MKRNRGDDGVRGAEPSTGAPDLEALPGLGIIRARCLRKAGIGTLEALRAATVEQLSAIPGISPAKAAELAALVRVQEGAAAGEPGLGSVEPAVAVADDVAEAAVVARVAVQVAGCAAWLLQPPRYGAMRRCLARQVGRAAEVAGRVADHPPVGLDLEAETLRRLERLAVALERVAAGEGIDRAEQRRWADAIKRRRQKLESVCQ